MILIKLKTPNFYNNNELAVNLGYISESNIYKILLLNYE